MLHELASQAPDETALDDLVRRRTWAELADRATRAARLLREDLGIAPGEHAAVLMENRVEFVEVLLGAMLAGVWLTPINRHLKTEEIAYIVEDSGSRVLFADAEHEGVARQSAAGEVLLAGDEFEGALAQASDEPMPLEGPPGAAMIYTSGTTGRPKGVKRALAADLASAAATIRSASVSFGLDGSGPHLVTGPLYHAAPLLFALYDMLCGAPMVIMPRWDAAETLRLIEERGIRHTHLVPTMFVRLLRLDEKLRESFDPSSLSLVLHGAAPIAPDVKKRVIDWWGEVVVEYWGATESGTCTLASSSEWLEHPGTVGRATPTFEVFAVDDEGQRLGTGEVGLLYCRHKRLRQAFEYHGDPAKTAAAYLEPGVFTLDDIGYVDDEGYVYLSDRRSNMIVSGGVNIYPAEVEHVLAEHPAVADVAVFGIPDDEWGESVKAAVELVDRVGPSAELEAEIVAFGRERLADYKVPRSIDFERELPRHETGKLYVRQLRDRYWRGRDRNI